MCGIAGIITSRKDIIPSALQTMLDSQVHRGPDDGGTEILPFGNAWLGLGHRRLSIIDLSPAGHQPMVHPETGDVLIYNGEIYNFPEIRKALEARSCQFRGHSDTEVLLNALVSEGSACIHRLQGMFAFAFFSRTNADLILARDPLGIKPLYYATTDAGFLFASEVSAIIATELVPKILDRSGFAGYLAYGAVQGPGTIFRDVRALPGGCWQTVGPSAAEHISQKQPVQHWAYPVPDPSISGHLIAEEVADTLGRAVKSHLVSDVPTGVFLSSGLDSTAVASLAVSHARDIRTITVGYAEDPFTNESLMAGEIAKRLGSRHTEICVSGSDAQRWVLSWLDAMDMPSIDGLNVYVISKAVKQAGITVALSGQGGDELFGGYPSFEDVPRIMRMRKYLKYVSSLGDEWILRLVMRRFPESFTGKALDMIRSDGSITSLFLHRRRTLSNRQMSLLGYEPVSSDDAFSFVPRAGLPAFECSGADPVAELSRMESHFYLGNMLLRDGDVFSMANSLEIRVPMLDRNVLDLAYRIPGRMRLPDAKANKHLLRQAFKGVYTPEMLAQKKRGFSLPIGRWMTTVLREQCESGIAALKRSGVINPEGADEVWSTFLREPESPAWSRAWELAVAGIYLRKSGAV